MRKLAAILATTTLLAATPSLADSPYATPPGKGAKVCLVTFGTAEEALAGADADVVKAQYVPLAIALKLEARNDDVADIYTYGDLGYDGVEVDHHVASDMTTEEVCSYLSDLSDQATDDDSDDDSDDD